ncbi:MAG TPA: DegT/DnrJ/EryC1/StrS family aminotransferase [Clostridiales bacterium]|nr:DegT/DnrJ/EryC1/StrS family aminotransferase [Clostridiales bacterium]
MINVTRSSMPPFEEYCDEIKKIWDSRWLTNNGIEHRTLENELCEKFNVKNTVLFANGHLALECAIAGYDFPSGSEVITTPFTFASTTHAIARNGLVPVFCDINPDDYTIDVSKIEELITDKTVAIVPVHVYGNMCDVYAIDKIAKKHGLRVIYDAAHAFNVTYKGVSSACFGDASMFSFHATKVFHTIEGGGICTANDELAKYLNHIKNFGQDGEDCIYAGTNCKMNEFAAAMGVCNLRHLDEEIAKRKLVADRYIKRLSGAKGIKLSIPSDDTVQNYAYFPVLFDGYKLNRDEVFDLLGKHDIVPRKYFYPLTNSFTCYNNLETAGEDKTPVAKHIANNILCLPIYADLTVAEVDRICDLILQ